MKLKNSFFYTLREDSKEEDSRSGNLLVKAGFIKKSSSGVYMMMPLGYKVLKNIENIVREVPIIVSVVDTTAPVITLKEESIQITEGEEYNFLDNIESVTDEVDGTIEFLEEVLEDSVNYYNLSYEENVFDVGVHEIKVVAKDKYGNEATATYNFEVKEKPKPKPQERVYANLPANPSGGDISSIAYSLVGMPYASGANGPYAFDCSGFVQYVYSQVGINVSRSSSTQLYDG